MSALLRKPDPDFVSFLNAPVQTEVESLEADIAVLGAPHGVPYNMAGVSGGCALAPATIRASSARFGYGGFIDHWDFDLGGPLLDGKGPQIVDCGDVAADPLDIPGNVERIRRAVGMILDAGAVPIVLGGDDSIPIPVLAAYEGRPELTIVQIDAHIDWRDEVHGVTHGFSSPMRRASEMDWVGDIIQIGMRGPGSARKTELDDALAYGVRIITASEVHESGDLQVLDQIPDGRDYFITLDCDGLDPTVMPGVGAPAPGGLTFPHTCAILRGLAGKGRVVGMDLVEYVPERDLNGLTALTATRLILNLIGAMVRSGQLAR